MGEQVGRDRALTDCAAVRASASSNIGSTEDEVFAAPIITVMGNVSIFLFMVAMVTEEDSAAARADDFATEEVQKIALLRAGFMPGDTLLGLPESIGRDDGRAKIVDAVAPAGVRLIAQDTADTAACDRDAKLDEDVVRDPHR